MQEIGDMMLNPSMTKNGRKVKRQTKQGGKEQTVQLNPGTTGSHENQQ